MSQFQWFWWTGLYHKDAENCVEYMENARIIHWPFDRVQRVWWTQGSTRGLIFTLIFTRSVNRGCTLGEIGLRCCWYWRLYSHRANIEKLPVPESWLIYPLLPIPPLPPFKNSRVIWQLDIHISGTYLCQLVGRWRFQILISAAWLLITKNDMNQIVHI